MNVSLSYKAYIHTHYEDYFNVEWVKITGENIKFKASDNSTHVVPLKYLISLSVTQ